MLSSVGFLLHRHRKVSPMPSCLCPGKKADRRTGSEEMEAGTQQDHIYICRKPLMFTGLRGLCEQANLPSPTGKCRPCSSSLK